MNVRFKSKYSLSNQIEEKIIEYIKAGVYGADEKLPSIRELAVELQVNPNTVVKAYTALEEKGYIYSLLKKGYYVSASDIQTHGDLESNDDYKPLRQEIEKAIKAVGYDEARAIIEKILSKEETLRDKD